MGRAAVLVAVILAAGLALLAALRHGAPGEPPLARSAWPGARVLVASAPSLPELAHFDVNPLNPFVPWHARSRRATRPGGDGILVTGTDRDGRDVPPSPSGGSPARRWPTAAALSPALVPVGVVVHERGARALVVRTSDGMRVLAPGDEVIGWRLEEVDADTARFTAPGGRALALAIPQR